ncbi:MULTISPECIES: IclR family transcriptional regulator [unclassified Ruegeria]|uniref:IclR family transcriptional regulator n=1 Tax=unclassified Ruegeria TaxID=2625375 RepID=UPI001488764D|nr:MULTISPECIES: IclR family transcriptional regulator [unclassified Ruegeria]NOD76412.1 helix-turn-helix domain-containing protein [Ruegeria sp. HKCCD4332]NOD89125.1 helix-turn-helix domain-containing protein [Ruegeria sp. HKCCD4318]NOE13712.1 helix-turn-helix domain-containing protein [Ruegeria sp. HKCCD4318-2]NOG07537.1 IclR family transcriptional regulator [Ruegeria sp. HKCCD4315]
MAETETQDKETQIPTNLRLLLILEEVARRGVAIKPADLIETLGLAKPTVHRLLQTAEAEGFLQRDLDGRSYGPGHRLRLLSVNTMSSEHLRTARLAILRSVAENVGETCNLAIPDREGMIYLDRVETKWPLRIQLPIGTQVPFHCTASGKMYLSTLRQKTLDGFLSAGNLQPQSERSLTDPKALRDEIRGISEKGYATDDEEFMAGMTAIAVPIRDGQGRLVGTLSVHAPTQRHDVNSLLSFLNILQKGAGELSEMLID